MRVTASPDRRMRRFGPARASSRTTCAFRGSEQGRSLAHDALAVQFTKVAASPETRMLRFAAHRPSLRTICALRGREQGRSLAYEALAVPLAEIAASRTSWMSALVLFNGPRTRY